MRILHIVGIAIVGFLLFARPVSATVSYTHSGSSNPLSEGWTASLGDANTTASGFNDAGTPTWQVIDNSTAAGGGLYYTKVPTATDISQFSSSGWDMTVGLKLPLANQSTGTITSLYRNGTTNWQLIFGTNAAGDPIVYTQTASSGLASGPNYTLTGAGATYNTYDLRYDSISHLANLFVNGVDRIAGYAGVPFSTTEIDWGAGSSISTGTGNFSSFSMTPEPASISLLLFGAVGFLSRRRRI